MSSYSARILQTHWKLRAPRVSPYHSVVMLLTLLAAAVPMCPEGAARVGCALSACMSLSLCAVRVL